MNKDNVVKVLRICEVDESSAIISLLSEFFNVKTDEVWHHI